MVDFLLSDNGVEWVEFEDLFKFVATQIVLNFFKLDLDLDLYAVRRCWCIT